MTLPLIPDRSTDDRTWRKRVAETINNILRGLWTPVTIGGSSVVTVTGETPALQIQGDNAFVTLLRYKNTSGGPNLILGHSRNDAIGGHTILQDGDEIGAVSFAASNGTAFDYNVARIIAFINGTPGSSGDMPTRLSIYTTGDGSATPAERIRIGNAGGALSLYAGPAVDHVYMQFYARSASPTVRSGYFGYGGSATSHCDLTNEITDGDIRLGTTGTGKVLANLVPVVAGYTAYKASQTSRTNNTLADDPELIASSVPAGTWMIKGFLAPQCPSATTSGFKFSLRIGGSKTGAHYINYFGVANLTAVAPTLGANVSTVVQFTDITTGSVFDFINFEAVVSTTTAGDIALQWAQRTTSANATQLNDRSWMTITRLA